MIKIARTNGNLDIQKDRSKQIGQILNILASLIGKTKEEGAWNMLGLNKIKRIFIFQIQYAV